MTFTTGCSKSLNTTDSLQNYITISLNTVETFSLYAWESKVILQELGNKTVQTSQHIAGQTKAPVGVNIFLDLLVCLLKGHLALEAKERPNNSHNISESSIYSRLWPEPGKPKGEEYLNHQSGFTTFNIHLAGPV